MKKGFTLIEVTVALAIFGIAVVVLTQSFLGGMFSLESFKFDNIEKEALLFVYNRALSLDNCRDVEKGGAIKTLEKGIAKWTGTVQQTSTLNLYRVTLGVTFQEEKFSKKARSHEEEFYVYKPQWKQPEESDESISIRKV